MAARTLGYFWSLAQTQQTWTELLGDGAFTDADAGPAATAAAHKDGPSVA